MSWYIGTCEITIMALQVNSMVKRVCVYMGLESNSYSWLAQSCLICYYRINIISSVGHPRSDLIGLLVLWTVPYNGQGTDIRLLGIVSSLLRHNNISSRPYIIVMTYKTLFFFALNTSAIIDGSTPFFYQQNNTFSVLIEITLLANLCQTARLIL